MNRNYIYTFFVAIVGAYVFELFHLPIPWLLGSLLFVLLTQLFTNIPFKWPISFRNIGLMVVGFSMGHVFSIHILKDIWLMLPYILVSNILLLLVSVLLAYCIHKICHISFATMLVANVPGGLSQMIIFAEETKRLDVSIVTYFQVIRVVLVVMTVPILVYLFGKPTTVAALPYEGNIFTIIALALLLAMSFFLVKGGIRLHIPVPYFVVPLLFVMILKLTSLPVPVVPVSIVHLAQLCIGAYIGLLLKREMIQFSKRIIVMGIVSTFSLILFSFVLAIPVHTGVDTTLISTFLALAPGGLDQMGIVATAIHENVEVVTIFQLFRMLFVFLIVVPILQMLDTRAKKKDEVAEKVGI